MLINGKIRFIINLFLKSQKTRIFLTLYILNDQSQRIPYKNFITIKTKRIYTVNNTYKNTVFSESFLIALKTLKTH